MPRYVDQLLKQELDLPTDVELRIQRAHRALSGRPGPGAPPRSIVVNFLEYSIKEMILGRAWRRGVKIMVDNKRVLFDHDYAMAVVQRRKEYAGIKKVLMERGIRFQTPLDKMRIHWQSGTRTYGSAREAAMDMQDRGIEVDVPKSSAVGLEAELAQLRQATTWQRVGGARGGAAEPGAFVRRQERERRGME